MTSYIDYLQGFNRNRNRNLQTSKAPLESQAQGTSLFTSAASSQRGCPKEIARGRSESVSRGSKGHSFVIVIVIVISKFLKRHSKAKHRAPAYSRALRLVRRVVQESSPREVRVRFPVDQRGQSSC